MTTPDASAEHALLSIRDSLTEDGNFVFARATAKCVCGFSTWAEGSQDTPETWRREVCIDIATRHIFPLNAACRAAGDGGAPPSPVEPFAPLEPARFREFFIEDDLYDAVLAFSRERRLYPSEAAADLLRKGLRWP